MRLINGSGKRADRKGNSRSMRGPSRGTSAESSPSSGRRVVRNGGFWRPPGLGCYLGWARESAARGSLGS
jgi:hypothetical protein